MLYRGVALAISALSLFHSPALRAEPPLLQTTTPFLPQSLLEEAVKEVIATGKAEKRDLEQASWRLRLNCDHHALPPNWIAGATKPMFGWSCLVAWEHKLPVVSGDTWAAESETLITGTTDGDPASINLKSRLYAFLQLKPPSGK
ncbi:MAG: hypothetical protein PHU46_09295 [Rhodocyclaceae bacterium]|nr:hypothetical protein [Rhodocyclaceae bacterium]